VGFTSSKTSSRVIELKNSKNKSDEITKGVGNLKNEAPTFQLKEFPLFLSILKVS
jgi:hypothetical protein